MVKFVHANLRQNTPNGFQECYDFLGLKAFVMFVSLFQKKFTFYN